MVGLFFLGCFGALLAITWVIQKRRGDRQDFYGGGDQIDTRRMVSRLSMTSRNDGGPRF